MNIVLLIYPIDPVNSHQFPFIYSDIKTMGTSYLAVFNLDLKFYKYKRNKIFNVIIIK